jgi:thiaminase
VVTDTLARPNDLCAVLDEACAEEILALLNHPWVVAAAEDRLTDQQIGTWASQDLQWGDWYGPVMQIAFVNAPRPAREARDWLDANMDREIGWFREIAARFGQAPGSERIWIEFLGYGAWAQLIARRDLESTPPGQPPLRALTIARACEYSYYRVFSLIRDAHPAAEWARWAGAENWGSPGFTEMISNLSSGLNLAADGAKVPVGELIEIARQTLLCERQCWTAVWELRGYLL